MVQTKNNGSEVKNSNNLSLSEETVKNFVNNRTLVDVMNDFKKGDWNGQPLQVNY